MNWYNIVIRGLALGTLNEKTRGQFLSRELKMAAALSLILSVAGFSRAILFKTGLPEAIAITTALSMIVFSSVCLGAILPLILEFFGIDPAHSSTTIQGKLLFSINILFFFTAYDSHTDDVEVIMDILGVILAVVVSRTILDGPLGAYIVSWIG
jgi:Mg/Co/Ni transporter MgtE